MSTTVQGIHVVCPHCATTNRVPAERIGDGPACGRCKRALFTGAPAALDAVAFERQVASSDLPVVVDFWAPWCQPCLAMAPHFARAAGELEPHVRLAKLDTEAEQGLAARYGIRSIPTMIAFKGGSELARQSGALDAAGIVRWVRSVVAPA
jgi:thioredoxin 2